MRILFVVQRYGADVLGGGERATREYATRMAAMGHDVEVLTSRATSYVDWVDAYPEGSELDDGVTVHRLSVSAPRDHRYFGPLHDRVVNSRRPVAYLVQRDWMQMQGPDLPALPVWLRDNATRFDVVVFFTYLYPPTWAGLTALAGLAPTVLHPLAHDEPALKLSLFDAMFQLTDGLAFLAEEEQALVERRFRLRKPSIVSGVGIDLDVIDHTQHDVDGFRARFGLGDRPYLLYVGRVDESKGALVLANSYAAYAERHVADGRHKNAPALVLLGDEISTVPAHKGIAVTGAVDEATKNAALAGCLALVHPSYFESFSIVLCEAWAHRKPAIVQGECAVLAGQVRRAGGGIPYHGFAELEGAIDLLVDDPELCAELGAAGRRYVEHRYRWDELLGRYESFLGEVVSTWRRSPTPERRRAVRA